MGLVVATTFGLALWIVLWAIGTKPFDAFMLTLTIVLVVGAGRSVAPYLTGSRE